STALDGPRRPRLAAGGRHAGRHAWWRSRLSSRPMPIDEKIRARFAELEERLPSLINKNNAQFLDATGTAQWTTNVLHLLEVVFGKASIQYQSFSDSIRGTLGFASDLERPKGIFRAAREDYEKGYLFDLQATVSGELLGDFILLAKSALQEGQKDVAAV